MVDGDPSQFTEAAELAARSPAGDRGAGGAELGDGSVAGVTDVDVPGGGGAIDGDYAPYQKVLEADFSDFKTPGEYRLAVPGLGASFPVFH